MSETISQFRAPEMESVQETSHRALGSGCVGSTKPHTGGPNFSLKYIIQLFALPGCRPINTGVTLQHPRPPASWLSQVPSHSSFKLRIWFCPASWVPSLSGLSTATLLFNNSKKKTLISGFHNKWNKIVLGEKESRRCLSRWSNKAMS